MIGSDRSLLFFRFFFIGVYVVGFLEQQSTCSN